jgi:hypothetical protein
MSQRYSEARNDNLDTRKYSMLASKLVQLEYIWLSDTSLYRADVEACDQRSLLHVHQRTNLAYF